MEITRYASPKNKYTDYIQLADIHRDQPSYLIRQFTETQEEYKERHIYRVETTQAEMKSLYKEAASESEDTPLIPTYNPRKFENWRIVESGKPAARCQNFEQILYREPFSIAKKTYNSPVGRDNGIINEYLGDHKQTMELFGDTGHYLIEWDLPSLDMTEHIGVFCYERDKVLSDYDGVFEMPDEARQFLESCGFDCSYLD